MQRVVYTAILGNYEEFSQPDYPVKPGTQRVVFTDNADLKSDGWTVVPVKPRFANDSIRSARYLKIMGPALFADKDQSLWIDNTVRLKASPDKILDLLLADADIALPYHSYRETLAAEFGAVQAAGYDDFTKIYEQLFHYQTSHRDVLSQRPFWTGMMARCHKPNVTSAMTVWWEHILRYSRRDQLSINLALQSSPLRLFCYELDTLESQLHKWPVYSSRNHAKTAQNSILDAIQDIPAARLAKLEYENEELRRQLAQTQLSAS